MCYIVTCPKFHQKRRAKNQDCSCMSLCNAYTMYQCFDLGGAHGGIATHHVVPHYLNSLDQINVRLKQKQLHSIALHAWQVWTSQLSLWADPLQKASLHTETGKEIFQNHIQQCIKILAIQSISGVKAISLVWIGQVLRRSLNHAATVCVFDLANSRCQVRLNQAVADRTTIQVDQAWDKVVEHNCALICVGLYTTTACIYICNGAPCCTFTTFSNIL